MALHSGTRHPLNPAVGWLPITLSGVSAEVFRLAQLTGLLWRPTIALPIGTSRLHAADGMAVTTTGVVLAAPQANLRHHRGGIFGTNATSVVSRPFTGWVAGESDPPLASFAITSTVLSFQLPAGH